MGTSGHRKKHGRRPLHPRGPDRTREAAVSQQEPPVRFVRAQSGPVGRREKAFPLPSDAIPPTGKAFSSPQKEFHGRADEILPRKNDLIAREKETKPRFPFFRGDSPEGKRPSPEGKRPSPEGKRASPKGKSSPPVRPATKKEKRATQANEDRRLRKQRTCDRIRIAAVAGKPASHGLIRGRSST